MEDSLTMSSVEQTRLVALQQVLVSPFEYPSIDEWRAAVNIAARQVLQVPIAAFALPPTDKRAMCFSEDLSPETRRAFELLHFTDEGRRRAIALGLEVWNQTRIIAGDWAGYKRDPVVNEFLRPNKLHDAAGFVVNWPDVQAFGALVTYHERYGTELLADKGINMLRLALPAFKAGVRGVLRLAEHQAELAGIADALNLGLQFRASDGRVLHETPVLRRLMEADPESAALQSDMLRVARSLSRLATPSTKTRTRDFGEPLYREVQTTSARYCLHAVRLAGGFGGFEAIVVSVERITPKALSDNMLRRRFALTPREIQVARLIADGYANAEIARRLGVSLHTIRRHAERIREKLGVSRRGEVAKKLGAI